MRERTIKRDRRLPDVGANGEQLLAEVLARPDDDAPRLVYADHLLERGDPRGEFIALQCELARLSDATGPEAERLDARANELLTQHREAWVQPFMGDQRTVVINQRRYTRVPPSSWDFHRGFVREATLSTATFPVIAAGLFAREPVRRVHLTNRGLGPVLKAKGLERLAELDLSNMRLKDDTRALFASKRFAALEVLELRKCGLGVKGARAMQEADPKHWPKLHHLGLGENALKDAALRELAHAPLLSNVRSLELGRDGFTDDGFGHLMASPVLGPLEALDINAAALGVAGARALATSKVRRSLKVLRLRLCGLGDEGLGALLDVDFPALTELEVRANGLTDASCERLLRGWAGKLARLALEPDDTWERGNHFTRDALERLRAHFGARLDEA